MDQVNNPALSTYHRRGICGQMSRTKGDAGWSVARSNDGAEAANARGGGFGQPNGSHHLGASSERRIIQLTPRGASRPTRWACEQGRGKVSACDQRDGIG